MNNTDFFQINHFTGATGTASLHFDKRKRSYFEAISNDDEELWPKCKYQATEDKVTNALKNLNLSQQQPAAGVESKNNGRSFDFLFDEEEEECTGILLSHELRQTLEESKKNSDFELLRKMSMSNREINTDSTRLQVMLWNPNQNLAARIVQDISSNSDDKKKESKSPDEEYTVEEPVEIISKRSLKRPFSQVNELSIEEIDSKQNLSGFNYDHLNDPSRFYIVDEPQFVDKKLIDDASVLNTTDIVTISEVYEENDSMEL